ncbi:MAG: hypothetical protein C5S38_07260 [Candidatus Methanophagaceae archaeon]|nr:MAG: hypothetical protein C5S38_07260 [Methanophagales archaeon]
MITAHSPTGTNVNTEAPITVTFSEAMNNASAESAFEIPSSVSGSFSLDGNTMIFTPSSDLIPETTYTVFISTVAADLAGNHLESPYSWQFTTCAGGMDLVGEWDFDDGSGNTSADASGNGNDGSIYGAKWTTGKLGYALEFDGVDDYVDACSLWGYENISEWSIAFWLNFNALEDGGLISKPGYWLTGHDFTSIYHKTNDRLYFGYGGTLGYGGWSTLFYPVVDEWYHIGLTVSMVNESHSNIIMYVNGAFHDDVVVDWGPMKGSTAHLRIGGRAQGDGKPINGTIDEVKIYREALTAEEILADYEAGLNGTVNTLSGTVTSPDSTTGIADANVTLTTPEGTEIDTVQADSTGHYEFTALSPGDYDINATKHGYWPDSNPVTVTASAPATANIVLCQKGDFNTNSEPADAGDLAMMADATVNATLRDETYDLDGDGNPANENDLMLLKNVSVGVAELE